LSVTVSAKLASRMRRILPGYFVVVFLLTISGALSGYLKQDVVRMTDWLINYRAGFVRRGLPGELIIRLSDFSGTNPGIWVVMIQLAAYGVFFLFSFLLLRREKALLRFSMLVFSPFIFTFQINDPQGGYRKEILYFAVLAFIVWASRSLGEKAFRVLYFGIMATFPLLILSHEMLVFVVPWMLGVYFLRFEVNRRNGFLLVLVILLSLTAAVTSVLHPGRDLPLDRIVDAVTSRGFEISESSGMYFLHWDLETGFRSVAERIRDQHFLPKYLLVLLLSGMPYFLLRDRIARLLRRPWMPFLVLWSLMGSVALCAVAADWGRWINIQLISLFLVLLALDGRETPLVFRYDVKAWVLPFLLYVFMWHIPHFGGPVIARSFEQTTLGASLKSVKKLRHLMGKRDIPPLRMRKNTD